jgi:hypothetical protein
VGQLGLKSTVSVDMPTIRLYVVSLTVLTAVAICLRVAWVADVVLLAKKELRERREEDSEDDLTGDDNSIGGGSKDQGSFGDDDDYNQPQMSDRSFMTYFTVQAVIMASIIIAMWTTCLIRAVRYRSAVQSYEGER